MPMGKEQMIEALKSIEEPKLIQESDFQSDSILRVISSQGGCHLEVDVFPIDGPFEISQDDFNGMTNMTEEDDDFEGLLDASEDQLEMIEAGCEPEIPYFRYQMDVRRELSVFSEDRDELVGMLIEDVMNLVDCQLWEEMTDTELEEWYTWNTYADD